MVLPSAVKRLAEGILFLIAVSKALVKSLVVIIPAEMSTAMFLVLPASGGMVAVPLVKMKL